MSKNRTETHKGKALSMDDFIDTHRKKAKTCLSTEEKHIQDLDYMFNSVRGLITIIDEIWDNCKMYYKISTDSDVAESFYIPTYEYVEVKKSSSNMIMTTRQTLRSRVWNPPPIPQNLKNPISLDMSRNGILPDYKEYLSKAVLLCDELLLPLLTSFQEYLQDMHVYLGEVEEWLSQGDDNITFLNELFGKEIVTKERLKENHNSGGGRMPGWVHNDNSRTGVNRSRGWGHNLNSGWGNSRTDGNGWGHNDYSRSVVNRGGWDNSNIGWGRGWGKSEIDPFETVLYESHYLEKDCPIQWEINISKECGRKKLEAALAFAKTCKPINKVIIKDAGRKEVNGVYVADGIEDGVKKYSYLGSFNGKPVKFCLFRYNHGMGEKDWFISFSNYPANYSGPDESDFYRAPATNDNYELPPKVGWKLEPLGEGNLPQITYETCE